MSATAPSKLISRFSRRWLPAEVYDFWSRELGSTSAKDRIQARIIAKRAESSRAVTLVLQPNRRFKGFQPGQHTNLTVEIDGRRHTRSYSFTGIPREDGRVSLCVQRVEGGAVSTHLFTDAQVGDTVELSAPFGDMTLGTDLPHRVLLLAAGSGITPIMSLARELASRDMPVPITLIYWARHRSDLCFAAELKALSSEPNFDLRVALTGDAVTDAKELRGRPSAELFASAVPHLANCTTYACGPAGFVDSVTAICEGQVASFQAEAFTPPTIAPSEAAGTATVMLAKSNKVVTVSTARPLLEELEAQGVKPQYGCRMGICNTCACPKKEGITRNLKHGGDCADPDSNLRICVSSAQSDLTLDL